MKRLAIACAALIAGVFTVSPLALTATRQDQPAQVTPAQAAPFLGTWAVTATGQQGTATFDLTLAVEDGKVVGHIGGGGQMPPATVETISLVDKSLMLYYAFDYQGMSIDTVLSLTPPATSGPLTVQMDFAAGAYVSSGTATRKEAAKAN
jgi:hypothetical protein